MASSACPGHTSMSPRWGSGWPFVDERGSGQSVNEGRSLGSVVSGDHSGQRSLLRIQHEDDRNKADKASEAVLSDV